MPTGTKINTSEEDIAQILFKISFIMCDIQSKISIYGKKQENESYGKEKKHENKSWHGTPVEFCRNFQAAVVRMFRFKGNAISMSKAKGISAERWKE